MRDICSTSLLHFSQKLLITFVTLKLLIKMNLAFKYIDRVRQKLTTFNILTLYLYTLLELIPWTIVAEVTSLMSALEIGIV